MINSKEWNEDASSIIDEEMESEQTKYYTHREQDSIIQQEGV